ncbi:ATP-dependent helicase [Geodermatophilus sabuli]|uniref:DNA 3'-5' helicase n=1 Tax=Geodermatophilus sabuli TaxID=1564158 RepID=A0A285EHC0_9ACTN|nr:ATP-dependent DNA helicase UvrD2 [Geodermatophilus sabuli]MBB3086047.1 DNA helicase-2/ATP-dependent DNA helicase PcrA [Geodermatophilus sabuli]SNX98387.1 ATP-dependent DNA helicase, Rep family [Geodermatophilus sabuli]
MSQLAGAPDVVQGAEAVLAQLDDEQRAAAQAVTGPVCILAGAGTGKTRTITHRIAYGVHTGVFVPEQVLAVTFTARAAGELRARLAGLGVGGVQARTFHAAAMRQLRYFAPRVLGGPMPGLVENKLRLVASAASRSRLSTDRTSLRDLASEIEWAKTTLATPDDYPVRAQAAGREPPFEPAAVAQVYAGYESAKQRDGVLDFEDLLLVTAYALEEHREVAREVRAQYRHFVVDEYQDVNPLQQRLLDAWLGGRASVCVVGDPNQTIYSFTGADPDYLLGFADRYPDAEVVKLERDYRSTPQVVALANKLIGQAPRRKGLPGLRLLGQRAEGPAPRFFEHADEPTEAAAVAQACRAFIEAGTPAAEIAVLFRINAQSEVYENALTDAGVPYVLKGGERFFERPEVREAVLLLRGAAAGGSEPGALVPTVRDVLASTGWVEHRPPPGGAARDRWQSLAALVDLAVDLVAETPTLDLAGFVAHLAARADAQHAPTVQGVTLASMHAAKGLEWDVVFVVGLVDGVLPIAQSLSRPEAVEEERRLLYVAVTRAREQLTLSWSLTRNPGGRRSRPRSRFLTGLVPESAPTAAPAPRKQKRAKVVLEGAAGELFERLRTWRSEAAASASVPAYVVFTDATLQAIAESRPTTLRELAALPGVGARKLELYGEDVLATVSA